MGEYVLSAIHPGHVIPGVITVERIGTLRLTPRDGSPSRVFSFRRLHLLAAGKAAPWMAASCDHLIQYADTATIIGPAGIAGHVPGWVWLHGDHPIPWWNSTSAAIYVRNHVMNISRYDLSIVLLSGGTSAIMTLPVPGHTVQCIGRRTRELMHSGATIHELNAYRRSVDQLKGGGLSRLTAPGQTLCLMVSDVPGDSPVDIGSGPTVPARDPESRATGHLTGSHAWSYPYPVNTIITRNRDALTACAEFMTRCGYTVIISDHSLRGEARTTGLVLARYARMLKKRHSHGVCVVLGGETTVTVSGRGRGGRNLEMAASFATSIRGMDDIYLIALATDGKDGTSPSCGALVSGTTLNSNTVSSDEAARLLKDNNSHALLSACGATLFSGPTGTNVADIAVIAVP